MSRILIVEDDPDFQYLVGTILRRHGFDTHYAFTGDEGYEKMLSLNPDLAIVDMMLPVLNGAELIAKMKTTKGLEDIPVIVMTAYSQDANFLESTVKSLGAVEYLRKPVQMEELVRSVKRNLESRRERTLPGGLKLRKGAVSVDPKFKTLWIDDRLVATLPMRRFQVVLCLLQQKGEVSRRDLLKEVWSGSGNDDILDKTVQRLREDFGPQEGRRVQTTPEGYELIG